MPEPTNTTDPNADAVELATLRKVNAELLATKHSQKARIAELETERTMLIEQADNAVATMRAAVIDVPLRRMASQVSNVPKLWLEEFAKDYNFDANDDGTIKLLTKDGKPVFASDGKSPIDWTHVGLYQLLAGRATDTTTERSSVYRQLMRYAGASGAAIGSKVPGVRSPDKTADKPLAPAFGLR